MLVDDKLAKEKLARICEEMFSYARPTWTQMAQLIRNTDLTDCQPQNISIADYMASDQGSVRNATDELLREAVIAMAEDGWLYFGEEGMSDAQEKCLAAYKAIRALPVLEDQKD